VTDAFLIDTPNSVRRRRKRALAAYSTIRETGRHSWIENPKNNPPAFLEAPLDLENLEAPGCRTPLEAAAMDDTQGQVDAVLQVFLCLR
jgi:hypothetical protein